MRYIGYVAALVVLVSGFIFYIQYLKSEAYKSGYNEAVIEYNGRIQDLKTSLEKSNKEALALRDKQIDAYQKALEVRNSEYTRVDKELKDKLSKLEEFENEDDKDWFNTPVPDAYR